MNVECLCRWQASRYGRQDYDDLLQVGRLAAWRCLRKYRPGGRTETDYVKRDVRQAIARASQVIRRRRVTDTEYDDSQHAKPVRFEGEVEAHLFVDQVRMYPTSREVVHLYLDGYDAADIAQIRGVTQSAVRVTLRRAAARMRAALV